MTPQWNEARLPIEEKTLRSVFSDSILDNSLNESHVPLGQDPPGRVSELPAYRSLLWLAR
jgi:hypothetical protein